MVMKLRMKNVLMVLLLLGVFAVGTLGVSDTVDAAKWKKFDSGQIKGDDPIPGFKDTVKYVSYKKPNNIHMNLYMTRKSNNKNYKIAYIEFSKPNKNYVKQTSKFIGEKKTIETYKFPYSLKFAYEIIKNEFKSF